MLHLTGLITQFLAKCHKQATPYMNCSEHPSAHYHNMRKKTILGMHTMHWRKTEISFREKIKKCALPELRRIDVNMSHCEKFQPIGSDIF